MRAYSSLKNAAIVLFRLSGAMALLTIQARIYCAYVKKNLFPLCDITVQ